LIGGLEEEMMDKKIWTVKKDEENFPKNVLRYGEEVSKFRVWGSLLEGDERAVSVVGSRQMNEYGRKVTEELVSGLVSAGYLIVSGGARGIDSVAHETCLKKGGRTYCVLGGGHGHLYPKENRGLFEQISKSGAVLSVYEDDIAPLRQNFLDRNRVIAMLGLCVIVVGGRRRSGTLSTANHAANLGLEVFAVPGNIDSPFSEVTNYLIQGGAMAALCVEDVLEYLKGVV
jgi:DNA processing protein